MNSTHSARGRHLDSHLTYIPVGIQFAGEWSRYDVYLSAGGPQLGWVFRDRRGWTAQAPFSKGDRIMGPRRRTRWEAATALWPEQEPSACI